jgi:hypothetical protein
MFFRRFYHFARSPSAKFGPTPALTDIPREQCLRCALSNETGSDNTTKFLAANPPQL